MEVIISKELLSEVYGMDIINIIGRDKKNDLVFEIMKEYPCDEGFETKKVGTYINIHELAFLTRDYFKTKSKHLTLNQSIEDIFKEANSIYESLSSK